MDMTILIVAGTAIAAAAVTWLVTRGYFKARIQAQDELYRSRIENMDKMSAQAQVNYEKALAQMKETIVASMTAETEKLLRKREKELSEGNQNTMDGILKPLKESISAMEKAMKDNETSHVENTAKLSSLALSASLSTGSILYIINIINESMKNTSRIYNTLFTIYLPIGVLHQFS